MRRLPFLVRALLPRSRDARTRQQYPTEMRLFYPNDRQPVRTAEAGIMLNLVFPDILRDILVAVAPGLSHLVLAWLVLG